MSTEFASADLTLGQLNAIVKKLGGHDMALRFLRGELAVSERIRSWREEGGVIRFSVISRGLSGIDWITLFESKGFDIGKYAKELLRSSSFKPTTGVTTEVAILKGTFFEENERTTKKVYAEADRRKFHKPNAELACLIREKFTNEEIHAMGLYVILTMHEPIADSLGGKRLLFVPSKSDYRLLNACNTRPHFKLYPDQGFAFVVSQVSARS